MVLFEKDLQKAIETNTIETALNKIKDLLILAIVRTQQGNWIFE